MECIYYYLVLLSIISQYSIDANIVCSKYTEWDPELNICRDCPIDTVYNEDLHKCIKVKSAYKKCSTGYRFDEYEKKCMDINECNQQIDVCKINEYCRNLPGSYKCVVRRKFCGQGYEFNTTTQTCEDIDECKLNFKYCDSNLVCENVIGSFICHVSCPSNKPYYWNSACQQCKEGYDFNTTTNSCEDLDECVGPNKLSCKKFEEICVKQPGLSKCVTHCSGGTFKANNMCYDIDECTENKHNCTNTQRCDNYFGYFECHEINECMNAVPVCGANGQCIDKSGGYECQCHNGYKFQNGTCLDIDECAMNKEICGHMQCENTPGNFKCVCAPGFKMTFKNQCQDVNECLETPHICKSDKFSVTEEYRCFNLIGSYRCIQAACPAEYRIIHNEPHLKVCQLYDTQCSYDNHRECVQQLPEKLIYRVIEINKVTNPYKIGEIEIDDRDFDNLQTKITVKKSEDTKTKSIIDINDSIILRISPGGKSYLIYIIMDLPDSTEIVLEFYMKSVINSIEKIHSINELHVFVNHENQ